MQRQTRLWIAATLTFSSAGAFAQSGDLRDVTMRVLDSLDDVDAVVLSLDANRAEGELAAEAERAPAAADGIERERASGETAEGERRAERRERDDLHDTEVDERSEGQLEDRDVAARAAAAPTTP